MKRLAAVPIAALLAAVVLGACGSSSGSGTAAAVKPTPGGTIKYATDQLPDCLDPGFSPFDVVGTIDRNIVDSLVSESADSTFHPWLAQKWTISPDGRTYTFTLRPGVTFTDGTPFNAAAVKATLDHAVNPATKSEYAASLLGPYTGSTVVNDNTIALHLSTPFEPLLQVLSTPYLGIESPTALKQKESALCLHPVGTGPFTLVSWNKPTSVVLTRNPAYNWAPANATHQGPAYVNGITIQFVTEDASRFGSLTSGQSNVIQDVPPANVASLGSSDTVKVLKAQAPGGVYAVGLNTASGPLADERVRLALRSSVDVDTLVKSVYFGQYARAWSALSPTTPDYDPATVGSWKYDPAQANQLLDQAGWTGRDAAGYRTKDGKELTLQWPASNPRQGRSTIAQGIQAEAKKVGIHITYVNEDVGTYDLDLYFVKLDLVDSSFVRDEPDILRHFYASDQGILKGGANVFGLKVPQLDQWLNGAAASSDPAVRKQDYANVQQYVIQHALTIPIYVPTTLVGYQSSLHGVELDAIRAPLFYDAWIAS